MKQTPSEPFYIDVHFHADARAEGGDDLPRVARWMEANGVEQVIVLQLQRTMPSDEQEARRMLGNFETYRGRIHRFDVLLPSDVSSETEAVTALAKMKAEGAIGFGEHYGRGLHFDDPESMRLYAACAEVGLPVLFHMDAENNIDDDALSHLRHALQCHPECVFIGHAPGFWTRMRAADRLLEEHRNLYADISAGSGARALGHDTAYSADFLTRHADRVLFGTDGGPWSFDKEPPAQFSLVDDLALAAEVKAKLCRENSLSLFTLDRPAG